MQLECALRTFPLHELLDLCIRTVITGAVEVDTPAGCHRVFLRGGRIYHAESPRDRGFDALWPLFEITDSQFRFRSGLSSPDRTIDERSTILLQRAERVAAEWRAIRPMIASLDVMPQLVVPEDMEMVTIDEELWAVLCLADGVRTIREIAAEASIEPIDACRILVRLHRRGLMRLDQQRRYDARTLLARIKPAAVASEEPADASFFTRLLAALPPEALQRPDLAAAAQPPDHLPQVDAIMRLLNAC